jgi:branched-chain amino acid transport system permease protein
VRDFLQYSLSGLGIGAVYSILALGWVLVKQVSNLLFFLQGEFVVLTVFVVATMRGDGTPLVLAAAVALGLCLLFAYLIDVAIVRQLRNPTPFSEVVVLLGLALLSGHLIQDHFGPHPVSMGTFLSRRPIEIAGAFVTPHQVLTVAVVVALSLALRLLLGRTLVGLSLRASAGNPQGALLVGIRPSRVRTMGILGAALLGGIAGIVLGPLMPIGPTTGLLLSLKGFVAAVLGRWSFGAAVVAGAVLGLAETYAAGYVSSVYKDVISLGLLVAALLLQAALGERPARGPGSRLPVRGRSAA